MKFVFNDENEINSYGFRIPNKGISLGRFKKNPIMLDGHINDNSKVIGKWENYSIEGSLLKAEAVFDIQDESANVISGKVERGFIAGCSMGISFDRKNIVQEPNGIWVLDSCELYEASIVAIPSNKSSLRLYAENGVEMTEDEVKLAISDLQINDKTNKKENAKMEKITLTVATLHRLGFDDQPVNMDEVEEKVAKLHAAYEIEKTARVEAEKFVKAEAEKRVKSLVLSAKLDEKIVESEVLKYEEWARLNFDMTAEVIAKLPSAKKLSATNTGAKTDGNPATIAEFEKLSLEAKLTFKENFLEEYQALWKVK